MAALVVEELLEDFLQRSAPPGAGRDRPLEVARLENPRLHRPLQGGGPRAKLLDQLLFRVFAPTADLARIPAVFVKWLARPRWSGREGGLEKSGGRLLRAAQMSQQVVSAPTLVAGRSLPGSGAYGLEVFDRRTGEVLPALNQVAGEHMLIIIAGCGRAR